MAASRQGLITQGVGLFNAGRPAPALERFLLALKAAPRDAELLLFAGHCQAALGRAEKAEALFKRACRLHPRRPAAWLALGGLRRRRGLLLPAAAAFEKAGRAGRPELMSVRKELSERARPARRAAAAPAPASSREGLAAARGSEALLRALLERDPRNGEARAALSRLLLAKARRAGRGAGRLLEAAAALARCAPGPAGALERAVVLERRGRWDEAAGIYKRLAGDPRHGTRACFGLAHIEQVAGRASGARRWLKEAARSLVKSRPRGREGFASLMRLGLWGRAFALAEEILDGGAQLADVRMFWDPWSSDSLADPAAFREERARSLSRYLARRPGSPWALYYRGTLSDGAARFRDLSKVARLPRRYGWMNLKAGWALLSEGRFTEAAGLLRQAKERRPCDWWAHGFLAEAYLCLGRRGAALKELERARFAAPAEELGQVLAWRGELLLWLGRWKQAEAELARAERLGSLFAPAWRAAALLGMGREREALKRLDEALRRYPRDREAYVWRGEALRRLGLHSRALRDLTRKPDNVWARVNRGLLYAQRGDTEALAGEYGAVPEEMRLHVERLLRLPRHGGSPAHMRAVLEGMLAQAKGFRRDDYNHAVWLGPRVEP